MKQSILSTVHRCILGIARLQFAAGITGVMLGLLCISLGLVVGCNSKNKNDKNGTGDGGGSQTKVKTENVPPQTQGSKAKPDSGEERKPTAKTSNSLALTKDYFPQFGIERHLIRKQIGENGSVQEAAFTAKFSSDLETSWPTKNPRVRGSIKHRQKGEYLEYLNPGKADWARFLKLGAKPGDSWEYKYGGGLGRYIYKENIDLNEKPCAVLEYQWLKDGVACIKTTSWYVKDVGIVREQSSMSDEKGNWRNTGENLFEEWSDATASRYKELLGANLANGEKQPKTDDKKKTETLPARTITLTSEAKAVFTQVSMYGGRLFADGNKEDAPIVAVRAFGFGKDMKKLKELTSLEHLDLRERSSRQRDPDFDATALKRLTNLKTLALDPVTPQDLSHLAAIESLETLSFEIDLNSKQKNGATPNSIVQASLTEVAKVRHLKNLRIGNSSTAFACHPSDYNAIASFPELQYLEIWLLCDDTSLSAVCKSRSLKKLVIVFPMSFNGKAVFTSKGFASLANAPNLTAIQMNDADDALCENLSQLSNLKELVVGGRVSKDAISRIATKRPDLRILKYEEAFQPPCSEPRDNWMQSTSSEQVASGTVLDEDKFVSTWAVRNEQH